MEDLFQAQVEWNKEINVSFDDDQDAIFEPKIIISEENIPHTTTIEGTFVSKTERILDEMAYRISYKMRDKWGKNISKPLTGGHIDKIDKMGWIYFGDNAEVVIVKKDEKSQLDYLRHYLSNEDEYIIGSWNENVYAAISPELAGFKDENYYSLGSLIKEGFFEEFMSYIYENYNYCSCIRYEDYFDYEEYDIFLIDVNNWDEMK